MIALRILRRIVRKAIKPARLWLNARQHQQSEEHIEYLRSVREQLIAAEQRQHMRQVELSMQRRQIAGW